MRQAPRLEAEAREWPVLEPLSGNYERPVAINERVCIAGDRARVNLPLPSQLVSRAHALFLCDEHGVYLRDLASLSHVFVNEQQVREAELRDGDLLKIGPYEFRCSAPPAHPAGDPVAHAPAAELKTPDGSIRVPLTSRTVVLGRREDCDVIMSGDGVSPAHAVIFELDGKRHIRDLSSNSGTFVNDEKVEQAELQPGDAIRIGDSLLKYETSSPASEPAAAAPAPEDASDAIPLADESEDQESHAAENVPAADAQAGPPAIPSPDVKTEDSGMIIPLLDDSESSPGLPEPVIDIPKEAALAKEDASPPGSQPPQKRETAPRDTNPDRKTERRRYKKPTA